MNGYFDLNGAWPNTFGQLSALYRSLVGIGVARNDLGRTSFALSEHVRWLGRLAMSLWTLLGARALVSLTPINSEPPRRSLGYKYLDSRRDAFRNDLFQGWITVNTPSRMSADLKVHTVMLGLRWEFGPAPVASSPRRHRRHRHRLPSSQASRPLLSSSSSINPR